MAPAARSDALAKLHEGVKGSFPGVGLHEEPPEIELPDEGEEEFEARVLVSQHQPVDGGTQR